MNTTFADLSADHWQLSCETADGFRLEHRSYYRRVVLVPVCMLPVLGVNWLVDGPRDFKLMMTVIGAMAMLIIAGFYWHLEQVSRRLGPYLEVRDGEIRLRGDHRLRVDEFDGFDVVQEWRVNETVSRLILRSQSGKSYDLLMCNYHPSAVKLKQELDQRLQCITDRLPAQSPPEPQAW